MYLMDNMFILNLKQVQNNIGLTPFYQIQQHRKKFLPSVESMI